MRIAKTFENYPVGIVMFSNLISFMIYGLGFLIIKRLGIAASVLYLFYILIFEFRLIKSHCVNCYYWGKTCAFGKGRVSKLFFKRGNPSNFCAKGMTWKDLIPDMLISLIPLIAGIILLIVQFDITLLFAIILLVLFITFGNSIVRGKFACNYCKQRELGCPAEKFFNK